MPSFPKDILFSGGRAYVEGCAQFIALGNLRTGENSQRSRVLSFDATPFPRLPIRPLSPRSFLPQVLLLRAVARQKRDSSICSEATREPRKRRAATTRRRRRRRRFPPRSAKKRDDARCRCRCRPPDESLFPALAIHISRHESTDRYRRGPR